MTTPTGSCGISSSPRTVPTVNRSYPAKWAFSPTTAIGVIYANNPDGVLNYGKLRVSAGIQHTDYVPANGLWLDRWSNSHGQFWYGTNFASSWGAFLTQFPTSDFRQEAAYKANVGTDLRIANSLDFTVDAFYQQRRNILVSAGSLNSDVVGIQSSYDDKGRVASYGVEAGLRYAKTFAGGFSLFGGANASFVKSQVLEWIETPAYPNLSVIGTPADAARGLVSLGFFQNQAEIESSRTRRRSSPARCKSSARSRSATSSTRMSTTTASSTRTTWSRWIGASPSRPSTSASTWASSSRASA